uniref:Uncharacterized protein n=1 Tax=Craspedostauros australis TaxID=1486917 RepID=A0A7R9WVY0_9STRA|mmetsp:Transcript_20195/g.56286  ORF Transcript_20195/g.56286 Transcript_20195/m.56286 type:complete len:116 (+) Transcript_20195:16-363(+)
MLGELETVGDCWWSDVALSIGLGSVMRRKSTQRIAYPWTLQTEEKVIPCTKRIGNGASRPSRRCHYALSARKAGRCTNHEQGKTWLETMFICDRRIDLALSIIPRQLAHLPLFFV